MARPCDHVASRGESLIGCVGMPMGRVSPPVPFGICTRRTGGAQYAPDFAFPRASGGYLQVSLVVRGRLAVDSYGTVLAPVRR